MNVLCPQCEQPFEPVIRGNVIVDECGCTAVVRAPLIEHISFGRYWITIPARKRKVAS